MEAIKERDAYIAIKDSLSEKLTAQRLAYERLEADKIIELEEATINLNGDWAKRLGHLEVESKAKEDDLKSNARNELKKEYECQIRHLDKEVGKVKKEMGEKDQLITQLKVSLAAQEDAKEAIMKAKLLKASLEESESKLRHDQEHAGKLEASLRKTIADQNEDIMRLTKELSGHAGEAVGARRVHGDMASLQQEHDRLISRMAMMERELERARGDRPALKDNGGARSNPSSGGSPQASPGGMEKYYIWVET